MPVQIQYDAPPTVGAFQDSHAFVRCLMGPVGSGKSSGCVLEILRRAAEQARGPDGIRRTRFAVIRNTYGQLRDTTRKTFEAWIPPQLGGWNEQQFTFRMRFGDVDCEVLFRALDRPEDVRKLLSLDLTGAYINEAREISQHVFEVLQARVGRYPSKAQGGPTWFGIWLDTNPWHTGHWAAKLFRRAPQGFELYRQPSGRAAHAENVENLPAGYYERLCLGKSDDWVRVYVDGQEAQSDIGSIYGNLLDALEQRGGVCEFEHDADGVFTAWDLGGAGHRGDATAFWVFANGENGWPEVVEYFEYTGRPLSHYFDKLDELDYGYAKHFLPHDARAKSLQTGASVVEQFAGRYGAGAVAIAPELSLADGLEAGRWLLSRPIRFHTRAQAGVELLREYRYEWDEANHCFGNRPLHNFASHAADAYRYLASTARNAQLLMVKPRARAPDIRPAHLRFTLNELWAGHDAREERKGALHR